MEIYFLGTGEACDGNEPNTSMLLKTGKSETGGRIMLDCGFSVPHRYFSLNPDPDELEVLWISHFHGDHFFGTPLLLLWFWEMGRRKKLHIAGPPGVESKITRTLDLAYQNLFARLQFPLEFTEMDDGERKEINHCLLQTAYDEHSQPCLSLRLEVEGKGIFYSGDGRPTPNTLSLARGSDIVIHEAYGFEDTTPGHGSIASCLDFASRAGVRKLALLHIRRDIRRQAKPHIDSLKNKYPGLNVLLPGEGTVVRV